MRRPGKSVLPTFYLPGVLLDVIDLDGFVEQIFVEPVDDVLQPLDAMPGLSRTRKLV